jgi:hypothetical protein
MAAKRLFGFLFMYDRDKVLSDCLNCIEENELVFFHDLAEFIAPTMSALYQWEFEKLETIKEALYKNKVTQKRKLRKNWVKDDAAPVLQLAAYKLIAEPEEIIALTMARQEVTGAGGKDFNPVNVYIPDNGRNILHKAATGLPGESTDQPG